MGDIRMRFNYGKAVSVAAVLGMLALLPISPLRTQPTARCGVAPMGRTR